MNEKASQTPKRGACLRHVLCRMENFPTTPIPTGFAQQDKQKQEVLWKMQVSRL